MVSGVGMTGLKAPTKPLDMGNSGTAMRLMAGLLAAQPFPSQLIGDESLSNRPMRRIAVPLTSMGAKCVTDEDGTPPLYIRSVAQLEAIDYTLPVASAQIKSSILLAGLFAEGTTSVTESAPTRDHTERMLEAFGYACEVEQVGGISRKISLIGGGTLKATEIEVPADISSAAFFMVAASIVPGSKLTLKHVGVNPTRTGVIDILKSMGAEIELKNKRQSGGEPVADITVIYKGLKGTEIDPTLVPLAIDEFPVICVAAACAEGETTITGAEELRHKESDRISAMVSGLRALGVEITEHTDGMHIKGGAILGGQVDSHHDHRIAMSFLVLGCATEEAVEVDDGAPIKTSFPNFIDLMNGLGADIS